MSDEKVKPLTRAELVARIKGILAESGCDPDNQIMAIHEIRGSIHRIPTSREFKGPLLKPGAGGKGGKKKRSDDD